MSGVWGDPGETRRASGESADNHVGRRLRRLRERRGLSRRAVAERIGVDPTSVAGWERGKYAPRIEHREPLALLLGARADALFADHPDEPEIGAGSAALIDTLAELPSLINELLSNARCLRALRLAAPYPTPAYIQQPFRTQIGERLLAGTLEVQRIEIFYSLDRLKETLSNIFRYEGRPYVVKAFVAPFEVSPAMGGYYFDEGDFLLGAYWTGIPPSSQPSLRLSGEPFRTFFKAYWEEVWRRGRHLNVKGGHDLSAIRDLALSLGLPARSWKAFVEEARVLEVGDGAPPLP